MYRRTKATQHLTTFDETGIAKIEDVQVLIRADKRHFKKGEFFQMTFEFLGMIKDYKGSELKTLHALLSRLDYNNRIKAYSQAEIAKEVGTSQARISEALKRFKNDGIIIKDGREQYFSDSFIKYAGDIPNGNHAKSHTQPAPPAGN